MWIAFRGVLGRIFVSPAHHQVHHSANPKHFKNYGSCLALWDWMFGTLNVPEKEREPLTFGFADRPNAHTVKGELVEPLVNAAGTSSRCGRSAARKSLLCRLRSASGSALPGVVPERLDFAQPLPALLVARRLDHYRWVLRRACAEAAPAQYLALYRRAPGALDDLRSMKPFMIAGKARAEWKFLKGKFARVIMTMGMPGWFSLHAA